MNYIWKYVSTSVVVICLALLASPTLRAQEEELTEPMLELWPTYLSGTKVGVTSFLLLVRHPGCDTAKVSIVVDSALELTGYWQQTLPCSGDECEKEFTITNHGNEKGRIKIEVTCGDTQWSDSAFIVWDGYSTLFLSNLFKLPLPPNHPPSLEKQWDFIIDAREPLIYNYVYHLLDELEVTDRPGFFLSTISHWQRRQLLAADIPVERVRRPAKDSTSPQ